MPGGQWKRIPPLKTCLALNEKSVSINLFFKSIRTCEARLHSADDQPTIFENPTNSSVTTGAPQEPLLQGQFIPVCRKILDGYI